MDASNDKKIFIEPIGYVRAEVKEPSDVKAMHRNKSIGDFVSEIVFDKDLSESFEGITDFSHAWIIFHLHKAEKFESKTHPMGISYLPLYGIFATRSQYRPNHLALRIVELIDVKDNVLKVKGLDAIDGTPVVDIKPYIDAHDSVKDAKCPDWCEKLWKK